MLIVRIRLVVVALLVIVLLLLVLIIMLVLDSLLLDAVFNYPARFCLFVHYASLMHFLGLLTTLVNFCFLWPCF